MALEEIGPIEGWRRLWPQIKAEKGGYAGYIGMKIVMGNRRCSRSGIVSAIVMLLFLIPVGGLGAVAVIAGMAAGLTWNLYNITCCGRSRMRVRFYSFCTYFHWSRYQLYVLPGYASTSSLHVIPHWMCCCIPARRAR